MEVEYGYKRLTQPRPSAGRTKDATMIILVKDLNAMIKMLRWRNGQWCGGTIGMGNGVDNEG